MWHNIAAAFCLVLVLEGILPFANPRSWRKAVVMAAQMDDRALRLMGLASMLLGAGMLYFVHGQG